jgi:hypothetical protein
LWAVLIAYTTLFGVFAWPWLRVANDSFPRSVFGHAIDERLVGSILAWVAHALPTRPGALFDMPINYPAPLQLTGSEHFLSTQLAARLLADGQRDPGGERGGVRRLSARGGGDVLARPPTRL